MTLPAVPSQGDRPRFFTASEIMQIAPENPNWIVSTLLAREAITEVAAPIKVGKTDFSVAMVASIRSGRDFLGEPTQCAPVVYLTEERPTTFRGALARHGLDRDDEVYVLLRQETRELSYPECVALAVEKAVEVGAGVLIVDTLSDWAGLAGDSENSSGAAQEAMRPLQEAAEHGLAVLVPRHDRKGGGAIGESARGSTAFGGKVDIICHLERANTEGHNNRRKLTSVGRFDGIPPERIIERTPDGYQLLGTEADVEQAQARAFVLDALSTARDQATTVDELVASSRGMSKGSVGRALRTLIEEGPVMREKGAGNATSRAFGYWLCDEAPTDQISHTPPDQFNAARTDQRSVQSGGLRGGTDGSNGRTDQQSVPLISSGDQGADVSRTDQGSPLRGEDPTDQFDVTEGPQRADQHPNAFAEVVTGGADLGHLVDEALALGFELVGAEGGYA